VVSGGGTGFSPVAAKECTENNTQKSTNKNVTFPKE
jgi:hypothetical protein